MSAWRSRAHHRGSRGAAAVEFALVVPFLLLLVFGIIGYGYMLSFRQSISQGAAEGARAAAITTSTTANAASLAAVAALNQSMNSYGIACAIPAGATGGALSRGGTQVGTCAVSQAACANAPAGLPPAQCMSVSVDYAYRDNPLTPLPGVGVLLPQHLRFTSTAEIN